MKRMSYSHCFPLPSQVKKSDYLVCLQKTQTVLLSHPLLDSMTGSQSQEDDGCHWRLKPEHNSLLPSLESLKKQLQ